MNHDLQHVRELATRAREQADGDLVDAGDGRTRTVNTASLTQAVRTLAEAVTDLANFIERNERR